MISIGVEMMKKYTKQLSEQDEGIKAEHQIIRQYSRQQSNPDATAAAPAAVKKQKDKEAEEEVSKIYLQYLIYCLPFVTGQRTS